MYPHQPGPDRRRSAPDRLPALLANAVVVLGVATYGFGFPAGVDAGWAVRFAVLAALCALFGMLRRDQQLSLLTAVLAAAGFLEAVWNAVTGATGWPATAIVVVTALQAAAAVAALLTAPKPAAPDTAGYAAYVDYYNQAVRDYYSQHGQPATDTSRQQSGYGQAYDSAHSSAGARRAHRPSQYAEYSELDYGRPAETVAPQGDSRTAPSGRPTGLPAFGQAPTYADHSPHDAAEPPPTAGA